MIPCQYSNSSVHERSAASPALAAKRAGRFWRPFSKRLSEEDGAVGLEDWDGKGGGQSGAREAGGVVYCIHRTPRARAVVLLLPGDSSEGPCRIARKSGGKDAGVCSADGWPPERLLVAVVGERRGMFCFVFISLAAGCCGMWSCG